MTYGEGKILHLFRGEGHGDGGDNGSEGFVINWSLCRPVCVSV